MRKKEEETRILGKYMSFRGIGPKSGSRARKETGSLSKATEEKCNIISMAVFQIQRRLGPCAYTERKTITVIGTSETLSRLH